MVEAALDLQAEPLLYHLNGATVNRPSVPLASSFHEAPYGFYRVRDGHVVLSLSPIKLISEVLGDPEALQPFFAPSSAFERREEIYEALSPLLTDFTKSELLQRFRERGIWCAPVNSYDEAMADEAVAYLEPIQELDHPTAGKVKLLRHPIRFSSGRATVRRMPPALGEHTDEILQEIGYGKEEIGTLRDSGAV